MKRKIKLDDKDLVSLNQQWTAEEKKLFSDFLKWQKQSRSDFWDKLTSAQQQEIDNSISEIDQGETTDYETFMVKHRS